MSASETAPQHPEPAADGSAHPGVAEVTSWLLDGRFFTIDTAGKVTTWSAGAASAFGWSRKDVAGSSFAETLLAPDERPAQSERIEKLFNGGTSAAACFTGDVGALDASGGDLRAAFALVPIPISAGYEFNGLLQDVATRSRDRASLNELRTRHESVVRLIEQALNGKAAESAETEEGGRPAGALVVFRAGAAPASGQAKPGQADNVVSIADAAGLEEARSQLERARRDAEEARVEVRSLEGQLEEARREAQRARTEVDQARQEASDARDSLSLSQREIDELKRKLEEERRQADEARAGAESSRIRAEEAQRESDRLRLELREAREAARGAAGRADDELAKERADAERALCELADARAAAEGRAAEVETLRERVQTTQRELGTLRAELESTRAEAGEGFAIPAPRAADLERVRAEPAGVRAELAQARVVLDGAPVPR